jgi:hypothetical protein
MDRLPAKDLVQAVFESLVATYPNTGLIAAAIIESCRRAEALLLKQRDELATLGKEIRNEEAIERYLSAFEEKPFRKLSEGPGSDPSVRSWRSYRLGARNPPTPWNRIRRSTSRRARSLNLVVVGWSRSWTAALPLNRSRGFNH